MWMCSDQLCYDWCTLYYMHIHFLAYYSPWILWSSRPVAQCLFLKAIIVTSLGFWAAQYYCRYSWHGVKYTFAKVPFSKLLFIASKIEIFWEQFYHYNLPPQLNILFQSNIPRMIYCYAYFFHTHFHTRSISFRTFFGNVREFLYSSSICVQHLI